MIAVDPSALLAVIRSEPQADEVLAFCREPTRRLFISAASFLEGFIAAKRRFELHDGGGALRELCQKLRIEPVAFDVTQMAWAIEGYERFGQGRGSQPAVLNFGDCISYGLAMARNLPLLFVGNDFSKTDVVAALPVQGTR